jgi:hypothetical protein
MKASLALALLGCLALGACGSSSSARNPSGAAGNATGAAGSTGSAGAGGGLPMCQVDILPVLPMSFDGLAAGPTAKVRVRGSVTGPVQPSFEWRWTVSLADGTPETVEPVAASDASLVEFATEAFGTYTIAVDLMGTGTPCHGQRTITVAKPGANVASFRLHVTPPSTASVPAQDLTRQVTGGTPSGGNTLALDPGIDVGYDVGHAGTGVAVPSYVRFTEVNTGVVIEAHSVAGAPNVVRVAQGTYRMLVVPDGDIAPLAFPPRTAFDISSCGLDIDDGVALGGTVADAAGKPVAGATVVLRNDDLLSTTGKTDATGAFHLRARAGTFGLTVVTPLAAGGLEARLAAAGGLVVDATAPTPALAIKLQTSALVTGTVSLSATDPTSLGPTARVSIEGQKLPGAPAPPLPNVATLTVGAGAPRALAGDVHFSLHPGTDGTVSTGGVPAGKYDVTVFPASADTSDGVTKFNLDLTTGSLARPVSLLPKVMLTGTLLPAAASMGVLMVAQDKDGLPVTAQGDAGPDGSFALAVSQGLTYAMRALPRADQALARASFKDVPVSNMAETGLAYDMPPALLFSGRVVDPGLQGVSTALVQAFCVAKGPGCDDPSVPVAEAITRSDGTFWFMLPDPDGRP